MKKHLITVSLLLGLAGGAFSADLKVGLVDLRRAFAEYYKSKDASEKLKANVDKAKEEINERFAAYKKLMDEVQKKDKERTDPVLSQNERAKAEAELRSKMQELRSLEQDINEFKTRRQGQIDEEQRQQAKGLYDEIVKVVNDKAAAAGYDLVFDKSNMGIGGVPFLVYSKAGAVEDFTPQVIVELNKAAPAGGAEKQPDAPKAAPKKETGKKK